MFHDLERRWIDLLYKILNLGFDIFWNFEIYGFSEIEFLKLGLLYEPGILKLRVVE